MRRARRLVAAGLLLAGLVGCGGGQAAAPAGVRSALARVDAAVGARDYAGARVALDALVRQTLAARQRGELSRAQADRVLAAATRLGVDLPAPAPIATVSPQPTSTGGHGEHGKHGKGGGKHDD